MKKIGKKLLAMLLSVAMIMPMISYSADAALASFMFNLVMNKATAIVTQVLVKGINRATSGLEEDSPIVIMSNLLLGTSTSNPTLEACQEILYEVKAVDANVTETRNYLAQLMANLAIDEQYRDLRNRVDDINSVTSDLLVAWNAYIAYLEAAEEYASSIQASDDEEAFQAAWNNLYAKLDAMDFESILTQYVALVSTELAHYGTGSGTPNSSATYLDLLYDFCQTVYPFDYQSYEVMQNGINMNISYLQHAMELYTVYMQAERQNYETAYAAATDDTEKAELDAEIALTATQYQNCMNISINAINNIVDQYFDELQVMMRRYDLHVQYEMDYTSEKDIEATYIMDYPTLKDRNYSVEYHTKAVNTSAVMDFYRVRSADGKTWLFLKQSSDEIEDASLDRSEISLASLIEAFETDNPKSWNDMRVRMESMDWLNLLNTKDGKYTALTSVNDAVSMVSTLLYAAIGNSNFLSYVQAGGLTAVTGDSGNATTYLFIDDADTAVFDYGDFEDIFYDEEVFEDVHWAELAAMSYTDGGFVADCVKSSLENNYTTATNENVLVMLKEADDAVFEYQLNQQVQGDGTMSITVDGSEAGETVEAGKLLTINVKPGENQTLDTLVIKGEDKDWIVTPEEALQQLKDAGETIEDEEAKLAQLQMEYENSILNETLAESGDFATAQMEEDGSVTYCFVMPYQECTVTASFVKDVDNYNTISINYVHKTTGAGSGYAMVWNEAGDLLLDYNDPSGTQGYALFGETLTAKLHPGEGCYIASVNLTDTEGNKILDLSCLEEIHFAMPKQDCVLNIEFVEQTGKGTIDDPYLIPDYDTLVKYINLTQTGTETGTGTVDETKMEQYQNAHYRVTQSFAGNPTTPIGGMYLESGSFDGQNHEIKALDLVYGLFEYIGPGAEVKNVVLSGCVFDSRVTGYESAGVIAEVNEGTISHCEVKNVDGDSAGKISMGGIACDNTGIIINSGVDIDTELSAMYLGGIACSNTGQILNCYFCGTLIPTDETGAVAGITLDCYGEGSQIDNCYSAGTLSEPDAFSLEEDKVGPIVPSDAEVSELAEVEHVYYDLDGSLVRGSEVGIPETGLIYDSFKEILNENLCEGYMTWVRSDSVNGGYPTFEGQGLYAVAEKVAGSGSLVITRDNGANMSTGIYSGETISVSIQRPEGVVLNSLQLQDSSGNVLQDFGATTADSVSFTMPAQNVVVVADFSNLSTELTIAAKVDGVGKLKVYNASGETVTSAYANDSISVEALAGKGYVLSSLQMLDEDGNVIETFDSASETFTMGGQNIVLYAKFIESTDTYQLSTETTGSGSGTISLTTQDGAAAEQVVAVNTTIQVTVDPADGSYPAAIQVLDDDGNVLISLTDSYKDYLRDKNDDGTYSTSFTMPAANSTVQVTFETTPDLYTISTEVTGDGTAMVECISGLLYQGKTVENTVLSILAIPNTTEGSVESAAAYDVDGNKLADLTVDSTYTAEANEVCYTYTVPAQDVVIQIVFSESSYQLEDADGDGYYEISCYEDLVSMAYLIQHAPTTYAGAKYKQTNNIACGMQAWNTEIGTEAIPFEGVYEGGDYYVLGLRPSSEVSGLFGVIGTNGVVKNLKVVDFDYETAAEIAGGLAGINRGTIIGGGSGINITSAATVFRNNGDAVPITDLDSEIKATATAGGLVAINEGTILNSRSNANVTSGDVAGGLVGINSGTIQNVYNTGEVSGANVAGGIVGSNSGTIEYGYNNNAVTGAAVGGVAGTSTNENISSFWYVDTMTVACSNVADSSLDVTAMAADDMKTSTFADTLNAAIEGEGLAAWAYSSSKNAGYPTLESSVVVQMTLSSVNRTVSISGRIQPGATVKLVRLNGDDEEFMTMQEAMELGMVKDALKNGKFSDGWKMALVHPDGTYALYEGKLTITITDEKIAELKDKLILLLDEEGDYQLPKFTLDGNTLTIETEHLGSFAIVEQEEIEDEDSGDSNQNEDESSDSKNQNQNEDESSDSKNTNENGSGTNMETGDHTDIVPIVLVLVAALVVLVGLLFVKKRGKKSE